MNFIFLKITLRSAVTNKKPILTAKKNQYTGDARGDFYLYFDHHYQLFTLEVMASIFLFFSDSRFMNSPCGFFYPTDRKSKSPLVQGIIVEYTSSCLYDPNVNKSCWY